MTPDTPETLQSALADLRDRHNEAMKSLAKWSIDVDNAVARVAAFEKAQKQTDVEPDQLTEYDLGHLAGGSALTYIQNKAYARLVRLESVYADAQAELARLREGLKVQDGDYSDEIVDQEASWGSKWGREIQRHRKLVAK